MRYIAGRKLQACDDDTIHPFAFTNETRTVVGEGATFFLMGTSADASQYGQVRGILSSVPNSRPSPPDLQIVDAAGLTGRDADYLEHLHLESPLAAYTPIFGGTTSVAALSLAAAALSLKNQKLYATPVTDNPHGFSLAHRTDNARIQTVYCLSVNCYSNLRLIDIERPTS